MTSRRLTSSVILAATVCVALPVAAGDYEESIVPITQDSNDKWLFEFRPYLWTASIQGDAAVNGMPATDVDVGFDDLLDALTMTWASTINISHTGSKWSFFMDTFYLRLAPDLPTGPFGPDPIEAKSLVVKQGIVNPNIGYRIVEGPRGSMDLTAGLAWTYMSLDLRLQNTITGEELGPDGSADWFDLHIGCKGIYHFSEKWYGRGILDISPFNTGADFALQAGAGFGYEVNSLLALEAMYRYVYIDYDEGGTLWDTETHGVFLGVVFRW